VVWLGRYVGRETAGGHWHHRLLVTAPSAFTTGYVTHLLGDISDIVLSGALLNSRFLLWPLLTVPRYPGDNTAPWIRLLNLYQHPTTHPQIELILIAAAVFVFLRVRDRTHLSDA
jgi:hypothetical protein